MNSHLPIREPLLQKFLAGIYGVSGALAVHIKHFQPLDDDAQLDDFQMPSRSPCFPD